MYNILRDIISKKDSDGVEHRIAHQQELMSCGPASVYMAECLAKGKDVADSDGENKIKLIGLQFPNSLFMSNVFEGTKFGGYGSKVDNLINILVSVGLTVVRLTVVGHDETYRDSVSDKAHRAVIDTRLIKPLTPAIVLFGWYCRVERDSGSGRLVEWKRDGGHFVVATRVTKKGNIVYLDPWNGQATEVQNNSQYRPRYALQCVGRLEVVIYVKGNAS